MVYYLERAAGYFTILFIKLLNPFQSGYPTKNSITAIKTFLVLHTLFSFLSVLETYHHWWYPDPLLGLTSLLGSTILFFPHSLFAGISSSTLYWNGCRPPPFSLHKLPSWGQPQLPSQPPPSLSTCWLRKAAPSNQITALSLALPSQLPASQLSFEVPRALETQCVEKSIQSFYLCHILNTSDSTWHWQISE